MARERLQAPLVPAVVELCARIVHIFVIFLIDREVGEMCVLGALAEAHVVRLRGETDQAFVVDVDAPWVHRSDAHVEAKVEFEAVNQERIRHVSTDDTALVDGHLRNVIDL